MGLMKTGTTSFQKLLQGDERLEPYVHVESFYHTSANGLPLAKIEGAQKPVFVSDENLMRAYNRVQSIDESLAYLSKLNGDVLVLVTFREQRKFLTSAYKHHIRQTSYTGSFSDWIASDAGKSQLELCMVKGWYDKVVHYFPKEKVRVVLFEDMLSNYSEAMSEVFEHIGLDVGYDKLPVQNTGLKDISVLRKRVYNRLAKRFPGPFFGFVFRLFVLNGKLSLVRGEKELGWNELPNATRNELEKSFSEHNAFLSQLLGRDLPKHYLNEAT